MRQNSYSLRPEAKAAFSLDDRPVDKNLLQQLKLRKPEELTQAEIEAIHLQQAAGIIAKKKQRVQIIPSPLKGFALWEVESRSSFYEVYLPPIPNPHIVMHKENGGHIRKVLNEREEIYTIKQESISIIPAYTPTYVSCSGTVHTLHLTLPRNFIQRTLCSSDNVIDPRSYLGAHSNSEDTVAANLMAAIADYINQSRWRALSSMTTALTLHLLERYGDICETTADGLLDQKQMRLIDEFMRSRIGEVPDMNKLAETLQLDTAMLWRLFKATTGFTPLGHYRKLRLQHAKELIETSKKNLTEIAMDLGFTDAAHFSKTFHKYWGVAPSKLRTMKLAKIII